MDDGSGRVRAAWILVFSVRARMLRCARSHNARCHSSVLLARLSRSLRADRSVVFPSVAVLIPYPLPCHQHQHQQQQPPEHLVPGRLALACNFRKGAFDFCRIRRPHWLLVAFLLIGRSTSLALVDC